MDDIFGEIIGCGLGSDSIMLRLLRSAMDKAHEKVESTDGSIELLSAKSKFYELAMILVEGCSKLIEEKADVPETNREKMLSDLMESRNMVRGRIEELQIGMVEKDKELLERFENEWKLRQTLDLKERELVSLRAKVEFERTKSEGFDEGEGGGDIRELKHSVDQQVWSIKQKLEDERISLTGGDEFPSWGEEFEMTTENQFTRPEQKIVIERMSSDIDGLKGTLDLAFGRMEQVEMRPLEKQWGWEIEKETMLILIEGFMENVSEIFEVELEKRAKHESPSGLLDENWEQLIEEITCLHRELGDLCSSNEKEAKGVKTHESLELSTKIRRASSEPLPEFGVSEEPRNEDKDGDVSHVAKMIKSHESIIRKQREELNRLKREMILREKEESLSSKRLEDPNYPERRIQEVVARLDNVIKWKGKLQDEKGKFSDGQELGEKVCIDSICCRKQTGLNNEIRRLKQERDYSKAEIMIMEETYAILFKGLLKDFYIELENYETISATRDDIFTFLLKETVEEWKKGMDCDSSGNLIKEERNQFPICKSFSRNHQEVRTPLNFLESSIESKLKEDVYMVFIREMIMEWKMEFDAHDFENLIREEIHNFLIVEATKDSYTSPRESDRSPEVFGEENLIQTLDCSFSLNHQEVRTPLNFLESSIESKLKEDIYMVFIREMIMEWKMEFDAHDFENLIREEIHNFLIVEATKDSYTSPRELDRSPEVFGEENLIQTLDCSFSRNHQEVRNSLNFLESSIENKLKEDIYMVFIREMIMEWKMEFDAHDFENLIREEIHSFLIVEATKDSYTSPRESDKSPEVFGEENLIQTLDCLLKCVEVEEDLMLKASCEIKEHSANNDLVATECEEVDERDAIEWLLTEEENTFCSVSSKLERALQQLFISKELLRDLQESLGSSVGDTGKVYERENSFGLTRDNQIVQLNPSDANFLPLQQMLADFESTVQQKLEMNFMRLKELEHQTYLLTQLMASLRKRESLYKNAFVRRCHDLRLAETEVDLLGDQVDVLVGLLEKIYLTLDHYSPVLLPHFQVFDILKLIKKEISGVEP
ncbi:hypothetical protein RHGRI_027430 [Rhododendron griersonianum]|uniref:WPP domain-associated protein n=1 Tax=Rhododendron griersonianum TaxID=479676 RepID=A0AAV6IWM6_9ERIC|nr:hypothetical protein RHGRI_027430 [Rhododendron griersonianum]